MALITNTGVEGKVCSTCLSGSPLRSFREIEPMALFRGIAIAVAKRVIGRRRRNAGEAEQLPRYLPRNVLQVRRKPQPLSQRRHPQAGTPTRLVNVVFTSDNTMPHYIPRGLSKLIASFVDFASKVAVRGQVLRVTGAEITQASDRKPDSQSRRSLSPPGRCRIE